MATTYILKAAASDLSPSVEFNRELSEGSETVGSINVSVSAGTTDVGSGITVAANPGAAGETGNISVEVNVTSGNTAMEIAAQLHRINSSGTIQTSSSVATEQNGSAGVKTFNFVSVNLGTWAAGDRLRVDYRFRSTASHGSTGITIQTGNGNSEVATPWTIVSGTNFDETGRLVTVAATVTALDTRTGTVGVVTIVSGEFYRDGVILNQGTAAEGLLLNSRMVQATVDFSAETEVTNWDADANTAAFIAMLDDYRAKGLNAVTVSFQGGNFNAGWDEAYDAGAWNADGTLRAAHASRMADVIEACIANELIPIVGLTYFRQDQILTNETAVLNMVESAKTFLAPWFDKVIIEVTNESENALVSHAILQQDRNKEIVDDLVADGFIASASHHSGAVPTALQQGNGQVVLLHANGETLAGIGTMVASAQSTFPSLPIVINEDGDPARTPSEAVARLNASVDAGASWGFHDPTGYQYWDSTNMTTMDWAIDSALQIAVFDEFDTLSTPSGGGPQVLVPDSEISAGGWDDAGGVVVSPNLWQLVDEGITGADDDTSRLRSPSGPTSAAVEFGLTNATDPAVSTGHVIRARARLSVADATIDTTLALVEGTTVRASTTRQFTAADGTNWVTFSLTLTGTEADSITDYTDLRLRVTANQVAGTARRLQLTAVELEVPAVGGGAFDETGRLVSIAATVAATDVLGVAEDTSLAAAATVTIIDQAAFAESPAASIASTISASDQAAFTEALTAPIVATISVTDEVTGAFDETGRQVAITATVLATDGLSVTEAPDLSVAASLAATDLLGATEAVLVTATASVSVTDEVTGAFNETGRQALITATATATDALSASETAAVASTATLEADDLLVGVENLLVSVASTVSATDEVTGAFNETGRQITIVATVTSGDLGAFVEAVSVDVAATITATDGRFYEELTSITATSTIEASDAVTFTELTTTTGTLTLTATDVAAALENLAATVTATVSATEVWSGTPGSGRFQTGPVHVSQQTGGLTIVAGGQP